MMVWFVYDISSNKIRRKVIKGAKNMGLYRVQKSVFLGNLESNQIDEIALKSEDLIDFETDSLYIFPMCKEDFSKVKILGKGFDKKFVADEVISMFI